MGRMSKASNQFSECSFLPFVKVFVYPMIEGLLILSAAWSMSDAKNRANLPPSLQNKENSISHFVADAFWSNGN